MSDRALQDAVTRDTDRALEIIQDQAAVYGPGLSPSDELEIVVRGIITAIHEGG